MNDIDKLCVAVAELQLRVERLESGAALPPVPGATDPFGTVKQIVAAHYGVTVEQLMARDRKENVVWPRQVAMWLCRRGSDLSFTTIGESFGRDHGTVMHNCRSVEDRIATDQKVPGRLGAFAHHHAAHLNAVSNGMTYG